MGKIPEPSQKLFVSKPENNPSFVTRTVFQPCAAAPKISVCKESPNIAILSPGISDKDFVKSLYTAE